MIWEKWFSTFRQSEPEGNFFSYSFKLITSEWRISQWKGVSEGLRMSYVLKAKCEFLETRKKTEQENIFFSIYVWKSRTLKKFQANTAETGAWCHAFHFGLEFRAKFLNNSSSLKPTNERNGLASPEKRATLNPFIFRDKMPATISFLWLNSSLIFKQRIVNRLTYSFILATTDVFSV